MAKKAVTRRKREPWGKSAVIELKRRLKARKKNPESIANIAKDLKRTNGAVRQKMFALQIDAWGDPIRPQA